MPIVVECAECGGKFRAKDSLKDKEVPCPKCEKTLVVTGPRVPEYDVFLSHSSTDSDAANAICHALEEKRIRCWIAPRDIPPGKKWASAIVDGLAESRVLVLLLTEEAVLSPQVMNEIQQAVQQNLIIFPIRLKDVQLTTELSYFISRSHWLDAFPPPLDEYLNGIVKSVRALLVDDPCSDSKVDFPQTRQTITASPEKKSRRRFPLFPLLLLAGIFGAFFISWKLFGEPSVSEMLAMVQSDAPTTPTEANADQQQPDEHQPPIDPVETEKPPAEPEKPEAPTDRKPGQENQKPIEPEKVPADGPQKNPPVAVPLVPLVAEKPILPPPPPPDLISQPGEIDFSQAIAGRLPQGWSGSNFVSVDLGDGNPALKLSTEKTNENETIQTDDIRLGGDFFIELQLRFENAQKISLELASTAGGQTLLIPLEMTRNKGWVTNHEGKESAKFEPNEQRPRIPTWIRIEHTSDGLFMLADADFSRQKKIGDPRQVQFDRLSITFPPGSNQREIQNLRWGPLVDQPIPQTVNFDPPNQRGPNGLPTGWIRLTGQDGPVTQRIAARNLIIGEQFAIDLELQVKSGCECTLNLIGASDGPTLPLGFYFHQRTIDVRALNGTSTLAFGNELFLIRIERDGENFTVRSSTGSDLVSFRSDAFEGFDQIEFDLINGPDRLVSFKPPTVKLP